MKKFKKKKPSIVNLKNLAPTTPKAMPVPSMPMMKSSGYKF